MTTSSSFDDQLVRKLAEILNDTHLTEVEYVVGDIKVRVARQVPPPSLSSLSIPSMISGGGVSALPLTPSGSQEARPLEESAAGDAREPQDWSKHPGAIKAPMVGTVYSAAHPGSAPFVQIGSQITKGQTLFIIEAMKVMNQIRAPKEGRVTHILFHDGEPVEYDHPLMIIE